MSALKGPRLLIDHRGGPRHQFLDLARAWPKGHYGAFFHRVFLHSAKTRGFALYMIRLQLIGSVDWHLSNRLPRLSRRDNAENLSNPQQTSTLCRLNSSLGPA